MVPTQLTETERRTAAEFERWSLTFGDGLWGSYFRAANRKIASALLDSSAPAPASLLDLGCGPGGLLAEFRRLGGTGNYVGVDLAHGMLSCLPRNLGSPVLASAQRLPFADRTFDAVACLNAFHHFPNQPHALAEIARVLRPGGRLMLLDPTSDWPIRRLWTRCLDVLCDEHGIAAYPTRPALHAMMQAAGLRPLLVRGYLYVLTFTVAQKSGPPAAAETSGQGLMTQ